MYTHKPRTSAEIKADIAELKIALALALDDDRADMESDLASLLEELDEAEGAEADKGRSAYSGLDLVKVARAFGPNLPKDWDEGFLP
jgi:hypothetical protein